MKISKIFCLLVLFFSCKSSEVTDVDKAEAVQIKQEYATYPFFEWYNTFVEAPNVRVELEYLEPTFENYNEYFNNDPFPHFNDETDYEFDFLKDSYVEPNLDQCAKLINDFGYKIASVRFEPDFESFDIWSLEDLPDTDNHYMNVMKVKVYESLDYNNFGNPRMRTRMLNGGNFFDLERLIDDCYFNVGEKSLESLVFSSNYNALSECEDEVTKANCYKLPSTLKDFLNNSFNKTKTLIPEEFQAKIHDVSLKFENVENTNNKFWLFSPIDENNVYISPFLVRAVFIKIANSQIELIGKANSSIYRWRNPDKSKKEALSSEELNEYYRIRWQYISEEKQSANKELADLISEEFEKAFQFYFIHELAHFFTPNGEFNEHSCDCVATKVLQYSSNLDYQNIVLEILNLSLDQDDNVWGLTTYQRGEWIKRLSVIEQYQKLNSKTDCFDFEKLKKILN